MSFYLLEPNDLLIVHIFLPAKTIKYEGKYCPSSAKRSVGTRDSIYVNPEDYTCKTFYDCGLLANTLEMCKKGQYNPKSKECEEGFKCDMHKYYNIKALPKVYNYESKFISNKICEFLILFFVCFFLDDHLQNAVRLTEICENQNWGDHVPYPDPSCKAFAICGATKYTNEYGVCPKHSRFNPDTWSCDFEYECPRLFGNE